MNFGLYYWNQDFYVGLSSTHLTEGQLEDLSMDVARHYYFMAGYNYVATPDITIRPGVMVKSDAQKHIFDLNVNALHSTGFWGGLSYRLQDAIAPMLGYQTSFMNSTDTYDLEQSLRVGYSYDLTTSEIKTFSSGSHEIMVTYCFRFNPKVIIAPYSNPRFL
jgi:type IX secretion system PorP/SprF family membrane protein